MGSSGVAPTTYGGQKLKFGFLAVFRAGNEVGIDRSISVGYKGEFNIGVCGIEYILHSNIRK